MNVRNLSGLKGVAVFEAAKGAIVLIAGLGLFALIHQDLQDEAEEIVRFFHLNPAHHYPRVFLDAAAHANDHTLWLLSLFALMYACVRLCESYGLWHGRTWAEWFGALSGGVYLPVEIYEIVRHVTASRLVIMLLNAVLVAYLLYVVMVKNKKNGAGFRPHQEYP